MLGIVVIVLLLPWSRVDATSIVLLDVRFATFLMVLGWPSATGSGRRAV